jgi:FMN phosphatase YigB (HAD superfamily)
LSLNIKACIFDIFGTVVDWRTSVSRDLACFAQQKGIPNINWVEFADEWRKLYQPSLEEVRAPGAAAGQGEHQSDPAGPVGCRALGVSG